MQLSIASHRAAQAYCCSILTWLVLRLKLTVEPLIKPNLAKNAESPRTRVMLGLLYVILLLIARFCAAALGSSIKLLMGVVGEGAVLDAQHIDFRRLYAPTATAMRSKCQS